MSSSSSQKPKDIFVSEGSVKDRLAMWGKSKNQSSAASSTAVTPRSPPKTGFRKSAIATGAAVPSSSSESSLPSGSNHSAGSGGGGRFSDRLKALDRTAAMMGMNSSSSSLKFNQSISSSADLPPPPPAAAAPGGSASNSHTRPVVAKPSPNSRYKMSTGTSPTITAKTTAAAIAQNESTDNVTTSTSSLASTATAKYTKSRDYATMAGDVKGVSVKDRMKAWGSSKIAKVSKPEPPSVSSHNTPSSNAMEIQPSPSVDSATSQQSLKNSGNADQSATASVVSKSDSSTTTSEPPKKRWQPAAYSSLSLRKVNPPVEDGHKKYQANASPLPSVGLKKVVGPPTSTSKDVSNADKTPTPDHETVQSFQSSLYSVASLKRVPPPQEDKWKNKDKEEEYGDVVPGHDDDLTKVSSSLHVSTTKERPSLYSSLSLRSIGPPKEDKWRDLKANSHLSSAESEVDVVEASSSVRPKKASSGVHHFIPQPSGNQARSMRSEPELTLEDLSTPKNTDVSRVRKERQSIEEVLREKVGTPSSDSSGRPKKLLMLISTMSGRQDQKAAQERALTILKGMKIERGSELFEVLDGADPNHRTRRNELFAISGLRAKYPQFFLVDGDNTEFLADFESFEYMHDSGSLHDSMNLDAAKGLLSSSAHSKSGQPSTATEAAPVAPTCSATTATTTHSTITTSVEATESLITQRSGDTTLTVEHKTFSLIKTKTHETNDVSSGSNPNDTSSPELALSGVAVTEKNAVVEDAVEEGAQVDVGSQQKVEQSKVIADDSAVSEASFLTDKINSTEEPVEDVAVREVSSDEMVGKDEEPPGDDEPSPVDEKVHPKEEEDENAEVHEVVTDDRTYVDDVPPIEEPPMKEEPDVVDDKVHQGTSADMKGEDEDSPNNSVSEETLSDDEIEDEPLDEQLVDVDDSIPEHLRRANQPTRKESFDGVSIDEDELFENQEESSDPPEKPLLAAALKAKADENIPEHLRNVAQPSEAKSVDGVSLDDDELFDQEAEEIPEKPLLAAALKAKQEMQADLPTKSEPKSVDTTDDEVDEQILADLSTVLSPPTVDSLSKDDTDDGSEQPLDDSVVEHGTSDKTTESEPVDDTSTNEDPVAQNGAEAEDDDATTAAATPGKDISDCIENGAEEDSGDPTEISNVQDEDSSAMANADATVTATEILDSSSPDTEASSLENESSLSPEAIKPGANETPMTDAEAHQSASEVVEEPSPGADDRSTSESDDVIEEEISSSPKAPILEDVTSKEKTESVDNTDDGIHKDETPIADTEPLGAVGDYASTEDEEMPIEASEHPEHTVVGTQEEETPVEESDRVKVIEAEMETTGTIPEQELTSIVDADPVETTEANADAESDAPEEETPMAGNEPVDAIDADAGAHSGAQEEEEETLTEPSEVADTDGSTHDEATPVDTTDADTRDKEAPPSTADGHEDSETALDHKKPHASTTKDSQEIDITEEDGDSPGNDVPEATEEETSDNHDAVDDNKEVPLQNYPSNSLEEDRSETVVEDDVENSKDIDPSPQDQETENEIEAAEAVASKSPEQSTTDNEERDEVHPETPRSNAADISLPTNPQEKDDEFTIHRVEQVSRSPEVDENVLTTEEGIDGTETEPSDKAHDMADDIRADANIDAKEVEETTEAEGSEHLEAENDDDNKAIEKDSDSEHFEAGDNKEEETIDKEDSDTVEAENDGEEEAVEKKDSDIIEAEDDEDEEDVEKDDSERLEAEDDEDEEAVEKDDSERLEAAGDKEEEEEEAIEKGNSEHLEAGGEEGEAYQDTAEEIAGPIAEDIESSPKSQQEDDEGQETDDEEEEDLNDQHQTEKQRKLDDFFENNNSVVSESGWSDSYDASNRTDDASTLQQSFGTLGSAVIVDATVEALQQTEVHIPASPSTPKRGSKKDKGKEKVDKHTPSPKKKKKSKKHSVDKEEDSSSNPTSPSPSPSPRKKKESKTRTIGTEIVPNTDDGVGDAVTETPSPSKKKKKKKKKVDVS